MVGEKYKLQDLLYLMDRLRDPDNGCPWDVAQSFETIVPSTLEEAYEVADTIERGDFDHLPEELGDLLFQVIFYARLGKEQNLFDFDQIVDGLVGKLIRRHPHVFPTGQLTSQAHANSASEPDVKQQWEDIKQQERRNKGQSHILHDVPVNFPSISRAQKLQKRAAQVGFDFATVTAAMEKVREELGEVEQEIAQDSPGVQSPAMGEELGDLLFSVVNVCRLAGFDGESLLRATNRKFERRFSLMASYIEQDGAELSEVGLAAMELAWQQAKTDLHGKG